MACKSASPCAQTVQTRDSIIKTFSTNDDKRCCQAEGGHHDRRAVVLTLVFTSCTVPSVKGAVFHDTVLIVTSLEVKMSSGDVHPALAR